MRRFLDKESQADKEKAETAPQPPLFYFNCLASLELEAGTELNLAFAVKRAACFSKGAESGLICQRCRCCRSTQIVGGGVDASELGAIQDVESFAQELYIHALIDVETP
jgi:hypothetical protein